jgi:xanthine dehydrogenase large subunit
MAKQLRQRAPRVVAELEATSSTASGAGDARLQRREPSAEEGYRPEPGSFGISFNVVQLNQAGALVCLHRWLGLVSHGGTEMGQGLNTKVAQVVAHELGISLRQVRTAATDTSKVPNTSNTAASTGADLNGKAAQDAARQIRARLAQFAAQTYGGSPEDMCFVNDTVTINGNAVAFADLVQAAHNARVQLWSDGYYATPKIHWNQLTLHGGRASTTPTGRPNLGSHCGHADR